MYIKKYNSLNKNNILLVSIILSIFMFSQELRSIFGNVFYSYNMIGIISIVLLFYINIKKINKYKFIVFYLSIMLYMINAIFYEKSISNIISVILMFMLPLGLTLIEVEKDNYIYIFRYLIITINIVAIIIIVIGVFDYIIGTNINVIFSNFMSEGTRNQIISNSQHITGKRMYSFMGHPLYNTEIILMFYILNILYSKYIKKEESSVIILIIAAIGIALTASKTGFILFFIITLVLFKRFNKINKYLIIVLGVILAIRMGLFDTVLDRFISGNLTTGRSEKWQEIKSMNLYQLRFFQGYGKGFTNIINNYIESAYAAYEYPIRMFSLELGIFTSILIYIFILFFPLIILVSRKQWTLTCSYLIIFLDVNTYNGIAWSGDKMMLLCLYIFVVLNLSKYIKFINMNM